MFLQTRRFVRNVSDIPSLLGTPSATLDLLPPVAYIHQPASSFPVKFAAQAPSKTRSSVNVAIWTPDGRRCLTGTQAGEFCMWGGQSFQFETIIQAHETPVRAMAFTHAGNFLVSGDSNGAVRYWRTNLELVKSFVAHGEAIRQISFAPTDLKFATGSDDSVVKVWDFARVATEQVLAGHGGNVTCVDWHPSKALVVSGSKDGLLKLWCPKSGRALGTMHGHKGTVTSAAWASNGNWVLTGSRDQTCKVYDVRMQAELSTFTGQNDEIIKVSWHSLHEELFVSTGQHGSLSFWLVGRAGSQAEVRRAHEGAVWTAAWHPVGHLLMTGSSDATTKFWCRARPGDPFMEQQEAEQAELAALAENEAPVRALAPSLYSGPPALATPSERHAAIPGIGEAVARPKVAALDIYAAGAMAPMPPVVPSGPPSYDHMPGDTAVEPRAGEYTGERRGGRGYRDRDISAPRAPTSRGWAARGMRGRRRDGGGYGPPGGLRPPTGTEPYHQNGYTQAPEGYAVAPVQYGAAQAPAPHAPQYPQQASTAGGYSQGPRPMYPASAPPTEYPSNYPYQPR